MSNDIEPEGERDYGPFGIHLANDPDGALLVNAERVEGFDEDKISQEVEGLLFLGKLTRDCEIYGHLFTLRTLTRGERLAVALHIRDYEETMGVADAMQTGYLALAIETVDGRPLSIALGPNDTQGQLQRNFNIISKWYDPILETLWTEYRALMLTAQQAFAELEGKS